MRGAGWKCAGSLLSGRDLDDVVGLGLLLARRADPNIPGLGAEFDKRRRPEIAHSTLHSSDQRGQCVVDGAADFLESLDSLRGKLAILVGLVVPVAGRAPGLHCSERTHAAVLFRSEEHTSELQSLRHL